MKRVIRTLFIACTAMLAVSCNSSAPKGDVKQDASVTVSEGSEEKACCATAKSDDAVVCLNDTTASKVMVYYFHNTHRCSTCKAVESVTKSTIDKNFQNGVGFISVNREEENDLVEKFKISGQTLLIISGENKVDLTNDAFLNANKSPEKLEEKMKSVIHSMLK